MNFYCGWGEIDPALGVFACFFCPSLKSQQVRLSLLLHAVPSSAFFFPSLQSLHGLLTKDKGC